MSDKASLEYVASIDERMLGTDAEKQVQRTFEFFSPYVKDELAKYVMPAIKQLAMTAFEEGLMCQTTDEALTILQKRFRALQEAFVWTVMNS